MKNIFCLLTVALLATSCAYNKDVRIALRLAGDNRQELEQVLKHYADDEQKLRATEFLIGNMPGHYSFIPDKIVDFKRDYESIYFNDTLSIPQKKELLENMSAQHDFNNYVDEDVRIITADFLIQDIDRSFEIWENEPYCQHLTFEQFCELILPYKVVELQELDDWKTDLAASYNKMYDMLPNDTDYHNTHRAASALVEEMSAINIMNFVDDYQGITLYNKSTLRYVEFGDCVPYALSSVAMMRSKGIPACFEGVAQWPHEAGGHAWHTILNDNGVYMPTTVSLPGSFFFPGRRISKIFRSTYSADPFLAEYAQKSVAKLPMFNKFQKDVTALYIGVTNLKIPIKMRGLKEKYVYLATFDNVNWHPIAVGVLRGGKVAFNDVGLGNAYIILGYNGEKLVPVSEPFIVQTTGELEYCTAGDTTLDGVRLSRKYFKSGDTAYAESLVIDGQIQGANRADFSDADTLYVIEDQDYLDLIKINSTKHYRYFRYSQSDKKCSLAEFQLFSNDGRITGKIIASDTTGVKNAFDDNRLTSYTSPADSGWIGLDLGTPRAVDAIRIIPRSDDNGVSNGDKYELKYWANGGWVSLGEQVAHERFVTYDGVPAGALLLLSNNTRGHQERIFTLEKGEVQWW